MVLYFHMVLFFGRIKMADYIKSNIADGVDVLTVPADRFKTNEIAISLATPLSEHSASANALVIMLLSRSNARFKSLKELNTHLASLYGAILQPSVSKIGENQLLKLGITCIDDRFSLDDKKISIECANLLLSLLFEPNFDENHSFRESDVETEKRLLIEKIESEENEKRTYVLRKTEEIMFAGEPYAVNRYGTKESVSAQNANSLKAAWQNLLKSSQVLLTVVGNCAGDEIKSLLAEKFASVERNYKPLSKAVFKPAVDKVKEVKEEMNVKQGKLVMGFRVNLTPDDKLCSAMRSFADVFGGGPYSKLFANVREKMSLCYYCSARYVRQKSYIVVQSGCEEENMDKAVAEILNQIEEIKKGNFEYEFASSKIALSDAINSVYDGPDMLESWYISQVADGEFKSPKVSMAENEKVTAEEIIKCANLIELDTVYKLTAVKEGE